MKYDSWIYSSNPTESTCKILVIIRNKGRCGRNRVVVGFTTTCAISVSLKNTYLSQITVSH